MGLPLSYYYPSDAAALGQLTSTNGLVAKAGGGQSGATPLPSMINRIITVASPNDSVLLPAAINGTRLTITNAAASNSANVFPQLGDSINALGANNAFGLAAGKTADFVCTHSGQWHSILSA